MIAKVRGAKNQYRNSLMMRENVVGLLFAGGEGVTVFNRIQNVESQLGVTI